VSDISQVDDCSGDGNYDCFCDGEKYFLVMFEDRVVWILEREFRLIESEIMSQVDIPLSNISDLEYLGNFPSPPYTNLLVNANKK